jgi:small subunit ribosomal protein S3
MMETPADEERKPRGPRRDARPGERTDRPAPRGAARPVRSAGVNTAPADGSDKPAEGSGVAPADEAPKTTVKRVRKAAPAAAADGAKTE